MHFSFCQRIFISPEQRRISDSRSLRLRSKDRIDILIRIVLTITSASMLLGPSAVLYLVNGHNVLKLLLIGAFTVFFSVALHAFSKARRHENFAATSAWVSLMIYLACLPHKKKSHLSRAHSQSCNTVHLCRRIQETFSITVGLVIRFRRMCTPSTSCLLSLLLFLLYKSRASEDLT